MSLLSPREPNRLRLYRVGALADLLDVNPSTIWRWYRSGVLPPPVEIGGIKGWRESVLLKWMKARETA